ncbi:hypothetical protein A1O1_03834 [Capronia coronata CBS 617.96]|uniref:Uncharacterized protein n=1 Tax=Capronia coronata CBS 617.96 TaxID=1182541 RepID=W9YM22_9EURO|nr:uncharacterized protein A1O1_03834 [Capronia coronata CBS 617.96]EXJ90730.1 hypothetical protein A1O1_03834 [Capronia coronata CBS 617.96]
MSNNPNKNPWTNRPLPVERSAAYQPNQQVQAPPQGLEERQQRMEALRRQLRYPHALADSTLRWHLNRTDWNVNLAARSFWEDQQNPNALPANQPPRNGVRRAPTVGRERRNMVQDRLTAETHRTGALPAEYIEMAILHNDHRWGSEQVAADIARRNGDYTDLRERATAYRTPDNRTEVQDERLALLITITSTDSWYSARALLERHEWDLEAAIDEWMRLGDVAYVDVPKKRKRTGQQVPRYEDHGMRIGNPDMPRRVLGGRFEFEPRPTLPRPRDFTRAATSPPFSHRSPVTDQTAALRNSSRASNPAGSGPRRGGLTSSSTRTDARSQPLGNARGQAANLTETSRSISPARTLRSARSSVRRGSPTTASARTGVRPEPINTSGTAADTTQTSGAGTSTRTLRSMTAAPKSAPLGNKKAAADKTDTSRSLPSTPAAPPRTGVRRGFLIDGPTYEQAYVGVPDESKLRFEFIRKGEYHHRHFTGSFRIGSRSVPFRWDDTSDPSLNTSTVEFDWYDSAHVSKLNKWRVDAFRTITGEDLRGTNTPFNKYENLWLLEQEIMRNERRFYEAAGLSPGHTGPLTQQERAAFDAAARNWAPETHRLPTPLTQQELHDLTRDFNYTFAGTSRYMKRNLRMEPWPGPDALRIQKTKYKFKYMGAPRPWRTPYAIQAQRRRIKGIAKHLMVGTDENQDDLESDSDSDFEEKDQDSDDDSPDDGDDGDDGGRGRGGKGSSGKGKGRAT